MLDTSAALSRSTSRNGSNSVKHHQDPHWLYNNPPRAFALEPVGDAYVVAVHRQSRYGEGAKMFVQHEENLILGSLAQVPGWIAGVLDAQRDAEATVEGRQKANLLGLGSNQPQQATTTRE